MITRGNGSACGPRRIIALEQLAVMRLHECAGDPSKPGVKPIAIRIAEEPGKLLVIASSSSGSVCVCSSAIICNRCSTRAEKLGTLAASWYAGPPSGSSHCRSRTSSALQRGRDPKLRMRRPRSLLRLDEELDLADAATSQLDIVALDRELAAAAVRVHLPLHFVDVAESPQNQGVCAR